VNCAGHATLLRHFATVAGFSFGGALLQIRVLKRDESGKIANDSIQGGDDTFGMSRAILREASS
jgi:hypothetical protein